MSRVVTQAEIDAAPEGATIVVEQDAVVTPMAAERAAARGIAIQRGHVDSGGHDAPAVGEVAPGVERDMVRSVTRAVVSRLGDSGPDVVEAVVSEVLAELARSGQRPSGAAPVAGLYATARGATLASEAHQHLPVLDHCLSCVEQESARTRSRAVLTTTGKNSRGIVAALTSRIADFNGDIQDISQTLVGDFFTMIIVVDLGALSIPFDRFQEEINAAAREIGCHAMMMHEDVMVSLHRV